MPRLIRVGGGGGEISWHDALKDLRADDVLLLEPGFYLAEQGLKLADVTLKGMGSSPEDTVIMGFLETAADSRFVNLENLTVNTTSDHNSLIMPEEANGYLSLRNCVVKGAGKDTAALAINGQSTIELYSTRISNGSVSIYKQASFRLEMNDSYIDYASDKYCALALEGEGTAIINNSRVHGSTNTFAQTNIELDINSSQLDYLLLRGKVWLNLLNSHILAKDDSCLYLSDDCWCNLIDSAFNGGVYLDKSSRTIMQNCQLDRLVAVGQAKITMTGCQIAAHADFQDKVQAEAIRSTFNGGASYQYFLALSDQAQLKGQALIFNANGSDLAVKDEAVFSVSVLASDQARMEVECTKKPNVHIMGLHWTARKK